MWMCTVSSSVSHHHVYNITLPDYKQQHPSHSLLVCDQAVQYLFIARIGTMTSHPMRCFQGWAQGHFVKWNVIMCKWDHTVPVDEPWLRLGPQQRRWDLYVAEELLLVCLWGLTWGERKVKKINSSKYSNKYKDTGVYHFFLQGNLGRLTVKMELSASVLWYF